MWKNSLKDIESENNKILYETFTDFFLQRNVTDFLNKASYFRTLFPSFEKLHRRLEDNLQRRNTKTRKYIQPVEILAVAFK